MTRVELSDKFANMWRQIREDAGISQKKASQMMGVSTSTIQHWEEGTSCPNQLKGLEYFHALGLQPLPYYLQLFFPNEFENINADDSDARIENALITFMLHQTPATKRKLLFWSYGDHGAGHIASLDMFTAYLHLPIHDRVIISDMVLNLYEYREQTNTLNKCITKKHIKPNIDNLRKNIRQMKIASVKMKNSYVNLTDKGE